ncbi:MAG: ABC transporter permease [Acidobacteria bacterium]|nr:ABC transporter permease [Acidobacteriota bacterium]
MELLRRLWYLLNRRRLQRELAGEMEAHRAQMPDSRSFGSTLRLREDAGDSYGWQWLDVLEQDLRYAFRGFRRSPVFAFTSILILALGTGTNLAFFQVIQTLVWKPVPVRDPATMVRLERKGKTFSSSSVPYPMIQYIRRHNNVFSAVIAQTGGNMAWGDNAADRVHVQFVSANLFDEAGYGPEDGRLFHESLDERPGTPPVAVLSHGFWERRFGGATPAVGSTVRINDHPVTIVGIAQPSFPGLRPSPVDVYLLIHQYDHFTPGASFDTTWNAANAEFYARLKPGAGLASIEDGLRPLIQEMSRIYPDLVKPDETLPASPGTRRFMRDRDASQARAISALALAIVLAVLLVACSNLANLSLARANQRGAELSLRAAIGAGRSRIVRQLVTESLVLASIGTLCGFWFGYALLRLLESHPEVPDNLRFPADGWTVAASALLCTFATAFVGLVPALSISRGDILKGLRSVANTSPGRSVSWLQRLLLGAQMTGGCALVILAGIWANGFHRVVSRSPGFEYEKLAALDPSLARYGIKGESAREFWRQTRAALADQPGIESTALTSSVPLGRSLSEGRFSDTPNLSVTVFHVEPSFFETMRIPLLRGRNFLPDDEPRTNVIIAKRLAEHMYGTVDVVGRGFPKSKSSSTIVGVVLDARLIKITATNTTEIYEPLAPSAHESASLLVRTRQSPDRILDTLRIAARRVDSRILADTATISSNLDRRLSPSRLFGAVVSGIGALTLSLAAVGIFGLVAYCVSRRTREIGIRRTLGARDGAIVSSLIGDILIPLLGGLLLGSAAGLALAQALSGNPFYLDPRDFAGAAASITLLLAVVAVALFWPVRSALRLDPWKALRHD